MTAVEESYKMPVLLSRQPFQLQGVLPAEPADLTVAAHEPEAASTSEQAAAVETAVDFTGGGAAGPVCSSMQLRDPQQTERAQIEAGQGARRQPEHENEIAPTGKRGGSRSHKRVRKQDNSISKAAELMN